LNAATAWVLAKPEGGARDGVLGRIAFVLAENDPRAAANLAVKNMAPGEIQTEAVMSIIHRWAMQDWEGARAWVDQFPEGAVRQRAQEEVSGVRDHSEALKQANVVK